MQRAMAEHHHPGLGAPDHWIIDRVEGIHGSKRGCEKSLWLFGTMMMLAYYVAYRPHNIRRRGHMTCTNKCMIPFLVRQDLYPLHAMSDRAGGA